jgi:hypothetical protein
MTTFTALIIYRAEKPYGVGRTAHERHSRIVPGYRAEITDGLPDGQFCYTGVCETKEAVKAELIASLKDRGFSGVIQFAGEG